MNRMTPDLARLLVATRPTETGRQRRARERTQARREAEDARLATEALATGSRAAASRVPVSTVRVPRQRAAGQVGGRAPHPVDGLPS